jgi:hypothetical protein
VNFMTVQPHERTQRVVVGTVEGGPTFTVHARVRDEFIDETVEAPFGAREDGEPHEWAAYDDENED